LQETKKQKLAAPEGFVTGIDRGNWFHSSTQYSASAFGILYENVLKNVWRSIQHILVSQKSGLIESAGT